MENKDFSQIRLEDIEIHHYSCNTFSNLFFRNKIKTLSQILDDDLMSSIMTHCRKETRKELTAFISLMKYQYLDIPLATDIKLNEKYSDNQRSLLYNFGFVRKEVGNIEYFIKQNKYYFENKTMIDIFKKYISSEENVGYRPERAKRIMQMYIDSYEKSQLDSNANEAGLIKGENLDEADVLYILKSQLTKLISTRDILNTQIQHLVKQIELLSNHQPEDGIKK